MRIKYENIIYVNIYYEIILWIYIMNTYYGDILWIYYEPDLKFMHVINKY